MKKLFMLLFGAFMMSMMSTSVFAWELVPLTVMSEPDPKLIGHDNPRGPIESPTVYIEDYSLSFEADHPDYVLNIKDEDGEVVYTTTVYSVMTLVTLPATLSGDYEIELVYGGWLFSGYINL